MLLPPVQIEVGEALAVETAGAFTVTVMGYPSLTHPVVVLRTINVALYAPGARPAGKVMLMGLAGMVAFVTSDKPAVLAFASKSILYWLGDPLTAE